jgi:hypothetical protein
MHRDREKERSSDSVNVVEWVSVHDIRSEWPILIFYLNPAIALIYPIRKRADHNQNIKSINTARLGISDMTLPSSGFS